MSGIVSHRAGLAAEESVARRYVRDNRPIADRRWRGQSGELDLVAREDDVVIFVEVKKSRSFDRAAELVTPRKARRIMAAAEEYLSGQPDGQATDVRFDVALVNGAGEIRILENAFAA